MGIVIGVVVVLAFGTAAGFWFVMKKNSLSSSGSWKGNAVDVVVEVHPEEPVREEPGSIEMVQAVEPEPMFMEYVDPYA